ncbi:MAG: hypothetical protein ACI865_002805 [Flavobacteriaceae bacterium]|jgi:hypothetical protein
MIRTISPLKTKVAVTFTLIAIFFSQVSIGQVVINEVSAFKGIVDEFGDESDWIELLNITDEPVDLAGYHLSDNPDNWSKWEVPSVVLQPNERTLILASGEDKPYLAENWQSLILDTDEWRYFPAFYEPPANWNYESFDDQIWSLGNGGFGYGDEDDNTEIINSSVYYLRKTFELASLDDLRYLLFHADYDDGFIAYLNGVEIARSESMLGVTGTFDEYANDLHEAMLYQGLVPEHQLYGVSQIQNLLNEGENVLAVQVHNENANSSDLSGRFFLSLSAEEGSFDLDPAPEWIPDIYSLYHTNFKLSAGEPVILSDTEGNLVDFIDIYPSLSFGMTVGRTEDGLNNICVFETPTPWGSNEGSWCYEGIESAPEISLASGWYSGSQIASFTPTGTDQIIHFSTNGDLPTSSHPIYSSPITLDESTVLSARALSSGNMLPSKSADITCIIDEENYGLPVFSIMTDSLNLWDFNEGIYVSGPNAQEDFPFFGSNFWEPWSKWSRLEFFDGEQQLQAKAEFDLEIHGGWSRAEPQKSFRFDFKSVYTGSLEYPVFSRKPFIEEIGNLNIRNGGQHVSYDKIQDAVSSRIASKTHAHNTSFEPCILYLNGDYWGVYGIREKVDEQYIEDNFGVDEDSVDLLNSSAALAGTASDFVEAYVSLMNTEPQEEGYFNVLDAQFDVQNYIDYFVIETYIQNTDWMGIAWGLNNVKLWRSQQGGKWSYVLYDTDAGFGFFGAEPSDNFLQLARAPLYPSAHSNLFDRNLQNPKFKCDFANRYADLINTIFQPDEFNVELNDLQSLIVNAMPDHVDRWQAPFSVDYWNASIQNIQSYNALRIPSARDHVNGMLGFNGQVSVSLDVLPAGAGTIQISTISPDEYPWQGVYFNGCPVNISVIPNDGYEFNYWEENPFIDEEDQNNDSLLVNIQSASSFIAHFTQCNLEAEVLITAENNELSYASFGIVTFDEITWFMNGVVVGTGTIFEASQTGVYSVTIESGSCTFSSEDFEFIYIGINELGKVSISIWPNPAGEEIRVASPNIDLSGAILEIWSISGQLVLRQARPKNTISVDHLSAGVYQVRLTDGKVSEVVRLVVE